MNEDFAIVPFVEQASSLAQTIEQARTLALRGSRGLGSVPVSHGRSRRPAVSEFGLRPLLGGTPGANLEGAEPEPVVTEQIVPADSHEQQQDDRQDRSRRADVVDEVLFPPRMLLVEPADVAGVQEETDGQGSKRYEAEQPHLAHCLGVEVVRLQLGSRRQGECRGACTCQEMIEPDVQSVSEGLPSEARGGGSVAIHSFA